MSLEFQNPVYFPQFWILGKVFFGSGGNFFLYRVDSDHNNLIVELF